MGCSSPELKENLDKGIERQEKILKLMDLWYNQAAHCKPPPVDAPSVLSANAVCTYYYTKETQNKSNIATLVAQGLEAAIKGIPGVVISSADIVNVISSAVAGTTKNETSQGFSTCSVTSFLGKFNGKDCMYKAMAIVVSFNFSSEEYATKENVAGFGYWVYLLCTERPIPPIAGSLNEHGNMRLRSMDGKELPYEIPKDMSIVGKKYMTLSQLDDRNF